MGGACPGACPDGSGGARERAGGASFQGFLGLPRWPPPRSRPGARRPRVRVGVRRGRLCGSAGASAPVRRRVPGVRPARPAVPPPPLARRGPAGPRGRRAQSRPAVSAGGLSPQAGGVGAGRGLLACAGAQLWAVSERPPARRQLVLARQFKVPGGNRRVWAPGLEVQLLEGSQVEGVLEVGGAGREGGPSPCIPVGPGSRQGGLWCGTAESGRERAAGTGLFLCIVPAPSPKQNGTLFLHQRRPRRKAKVFPFLFCLKSPLIHYTETFKCLKLG